MTSSDEQLRDLLRHGSRNFRRYRRRAYIGFALLAATNAWALYQQDKANDKASRAAAQAKHAAARANEAAAQAKALAREIQRQRKESIRTNCRGQNRRHDRFIAALDREIARMPDGPKKQQALASRTVTLRIVDPLAPRQDCRALVRKSAPPALLKP